MLLKFLGIGYLYIYIVDYKTCLLTTGYQAVFGTLPEMAGTEVSRRNGTVSDWSECWITHFLWLKYHCLWQLVKVVLHMAPILVLRPLGKVINCEAAPTKCPSSSWKSCWPTYYLAQGCLYWCSCWEWSIGMSYAPSSKLIKSSSPNVFRINASK